MITGYEVRRYYDGVDGAGTLICCYCVSEYDSRQAAYRAARRRCGDDPALSMYALYDDEESARELARALKACARRSKESSE